MRIARGVLASVGTLDVSGKPVDTQAVSNFVVRGIGNTAFPLDCRKESRCLVK